jgi:Tol biopolymer transport system component
MTRSLQPLAALLALLALSSCRDDDPTEPEQSATSAKEAHAGVIAALPWRVVFEGIRLGGALDEEQWEVFIVNPNGSGLTNLSRNPFNDVDPVLSPDHRRVAFASERPDGDLNLYLIGVDGTGTKRLASAIGSDFSPSWSPDGTKLAFRHSLSLHVIKPDGTGEIDLGAFGGAPVSWSPDSRLIATEEVQDFWVRDIWVVRADGNGRTNLTKSTAPELEPAWSPDGTRLAFTRRTVVDRDAGLYYDDVWGMKADGTAQKRLTHTNFTRTAPKAGANHPSWSPDGRVILFQSDAPGASDLFTIRPDGTGLTNLTKTSNNSESSPHWSPDGSKIVFRKIVGAGNSEVFIMNANGSGVLNLSKHPRLDQP